MSDDAGRVFRDVQAYFRLPSAGLVEKDLQVVAAIAAIAATDASPYALVFGGGTALARAHRLVRRMSEDVDFKIVPQTIAPTSRNGQRRALGALIERVTAALHEAGFAFDPSDPNCTRSKNENHYTIWQLPYAPPGAGLRPTLQIELTYAPMRLPPVARSVSSFVAEAFGRPAEVPNIACVSVTETAAEKLVALTRRTAMERAGLSRDLDPTLIRHVYDLHMMHAHVETQKVAALARDMPRLMRRCSATSIRPMPMTSRPRQPRRWMRCPTTRRIAHVTIGLSPTWHTANGRNSIWRCGL